MHFFTSLLAPASLFFLTTVTVKAQFNPNVWTDSVATRRMLADTSMVSPFMPVGATKHDEKIAAIKAYCDCAAISFTERRDRFEVLRENWPKLSRKHNIYEVKDYILGIFKLRGENLSVPVQFKFSPLVNPLVHAEQLAVMAKEKQLFYPASEIKSEILTCHEQVRLMYPAYALPNLWDEYPQAKVEAARQSDLYDTYKHSTIEPWLDSVYKQPSVVTQLSERKPLLETEAKPRVPTARAFTTKPAPTLTKLSTIPRIRYKYPVFISTMDAHKRETVSQYNNIGGYSGYLNSKTNPGTYKGWYGYIDANGKSIKIDSTSNTESLPQGERLCDLIKYRDKFERDSFKITANDGFNNMYRIIMHPTGPSKVLFVLNHYETIRAPMGWALTNKLGQVVVSCKDFQCKENNRPERNSHIEYIGSNRYWVEQSCSTGYLLSVLYDADGKLLAQFEPKVNNSIYSHVGAVAPVPNSHRRYTGRYIALNNNTIIDLRGKVIFTTDKYKIGQIIDNTVLIAYSKLPSGFYTYSYINYRTGKVIYTDLDYERRSYSTTAND